MQFKKVLIEKLRLECIYFLLPFKLAPSVQDTHWSVLENSDVALRVYFLVKEGLGDRFFDPDKRYVRLLFGSTRSFELLKVLLCRDLHT